MLWPLQLDSESLLLLGNNFKNMWEIFSEDHI